jgi:adenylate cyclase
MKPQVLLVDDEPQVLQALQRAVLRNGCEVITASSGVDAFAVLGRQPIDVVVSDFMMPGMTGIELFARMRAEHPDITRVMLTGASDSEVALRALEQGAIFRFLNKPWDADALRAALCEAILHRDRKLESRHLLDFMDRRHSRQLDAIIDVVAAAKP